MTTRVFSLRFVAATAQTYPRDTANAVAVCGAISGYYYCTVARPYGQLGRMRTPNPGQMYSVTHCFENGSSFLKILLKMNKYLHVFFQKELLFSNQ
jgi:hypothetical protein